MDLFEYQAKELFARHGVPVTSQAVAATPEEARAAAEQIGGEVVVKAQVKTGGRGKAGGVKLAADPAEAQQRATDILGLDIRGHRVSLVLVTEAKDIAEEYYFSFMLDRANRTFLSIASREGGVDIEEVAATTPEAVAKVAVDPLTGIDAATARSIAEAARFPEEVLDQATDMIVKLWEVFTEEDATLVEVNPLVKTPDGALLALDGKVTLDDNSRFRHRDVFSAYEDKSAVDPLEQRALSLDLNYVKLDGEVGIIGNGAGLVMSTLDVVAYSGEEFGGIRPANFLDIGGGASAEIMSNGLEIVLSDPSVKSVFVNVFGGITSCIAVATGILQALAILDERGEKATKPLVVRLDGADVEEGRRLLAEANLDVVRSVDTMDGAARLAAELARAEATAAGFRTDG